MTTPPDEDQVTVMGNTQKKIGEDRTCNSEDMIVDGQTQRQTDTLITILRSPMGGRSNGMRVQQRKRNSV